jgi:hypothetical protein
MEHIKFLEYFVLKISGSYFWVTTRDETDGQTYQTKLTYITFSPGDTKSLAYLNKRTTIQKKELFVSVSSGFMCYNMTRFGEHPVSGTC